LKQRVDAGRLTKMDTARHAASAMAPRREINDGLF
jgi:two-component system, chemotaxis family, protein-glutamate methylesterase/glutaminase